VTRVSSGILEIANENALASSTLDLALADSGTLTITTGSVNLGGLSGARPLSLSSVTLAVGGNGQSTTFSGALLGSGTFVKVGAGTLTLAGTGSFSGAMVVSSGRLVGTTANLGGMITNNAVLQFAQTTDGTFAGQVISTSTNSTIQTIKSGTGTLTLGGPIDGNLTISGGRLVTTAGNLKGGQVVADGTLEFAQTTDGTFGGTLAGAGSLLKTGNGSLTLQAGSFTGSTTVTTGQLVASAATLRGPIRNDATLEFSQAVNSEYASTMSGSGIFLKSGAGTLVLSGTSLISGKTAVTEGTLATSGAERLADVSAVYIASTATLRLGGNETIAALLGSGSVNLQSFQLTIASGGSSAYAGSLFGAGGFTKAGSGALSLSGSSSFLGATNLNGGTLVLSSPTSLSPFTTLSIGAGSTLVLDADVRVFAYTNSGGTITGTGQLLTSATTTSSGTLSSLADVPGSDGYAVGLMKTSTGTLVVAGANSFTGGMVVEEGTVKLASGGSLDSSNVVEVRGGAMLDLNGQSQTVSALAGGGNVSLGGATLTVDAATSTTFAGTIEGGSLVKSGDSMLTLAGATSVTNATVNAGVLSVNGTLSGNVAVAPGGTLGGAGTILGDVTVSGIHAPGSSPEISTINGNLSYLGGASVVWELAANTSSQGPHGGRTYDQIMVGNDLMFTGSTALMLSFVDNDPDTSWTSTANWSNGFWATDRSWKLWQVSGTTTGFSNLTMQPETWIDSAGIAFSTALPQASFSLSLNGNDVHLVFTNPNGQGGSITVDVAGGSQTQDTAGRSLISGTAPFEKTGAGQLVLDQANPLTGPTMVSQGTLLLGIADALSTSAVSVAAGATLTVGPQVAAAVTALTNNGSVDVGLGRLTVAAGLTAAAVRSEIIAGRDDGTWGGLSGITSAGAAAEPGTRAVGWIDNGDGSFTIGFAAAGDLDMNGLVDLDDVIAFVNNGLYDTGLASAWAQGDYDYNGIVDLDDVIAFVNGGLYDQGPYNSPPSVMQLARGGGAIGINSLADQDLAVHGFAAVPEPSTCILLMCGAALALARRRSRCEQRKTMLGFDMIQKF
jgi:autotransporter-associated beta strand protein